MKPLTTKKQVGYLRSAKTILFGIFLSIMAGIPFLCAFLPDRVDYSETTKSITLVTGQNQVGNVVITVDQSGKAVLAKQTKRQVTHRVLGFRNRRALLMAGIPFFSLLAFCLFFFWYDKQPKTFHLLTLRRYTWRIFCFVSLWFLCRFTIPKPVDLSYAVYYLGTYLLVGISLAFVYYSYRYYCSSFRLKRRKIVGLISYIFEIRYKHYPRMACKAMYRMQAQQQTRQHIQAYESQTFEILAKVAPPRPVNKSKQYKLKLIVIGLLLSALAIAPLLYQFASRHVDYSQTTKTIPLKPGLNIIGNLRLTLGEHSKVLKAQKIKRQVIHKVSRFRNLRVFLAVISPFVTSLSFYLFFFWYEQQQKNPHVLALKRYVSTVFLLVSLWCACWTVLPERIPIPDNLYYIGTFVILCVGIASLQYLRRFCADRLRWLCVQATSLLLYVFKVKKRHYPRMAIKAMDHAVDYPETCREVEEYDKRTQQVIADSKEFMTDPKLRKEYDDYKRFKLDL